MMRRAASGFRRRAPAAGACLALSAVVACSSGRSSPDEGDSVLTLHVPYGDERIFSPFFDSNEKLLVFLPIASWDETGSPTPRLAERWEHTDDYRTWTFHLRPGVTWHDGVPVTAHDVAFTYELLGHRDAALMRPTGETVEVVDDTTLTITYLTRRASPPDRWQVYYPKHLLEELDPGALAEWDFWVRPVGNGPYRYVRHVPETMVELEANPDHYAGPPSIDRIVLQFGGGSSLVELLSGNVDVVAIDRIELPRIAEDPRFAVHHYMWPGAGWVHAVFWNHADPRFTDPRVRRALTMAIDRAELYQLEALPPETPIVDVVYTERQYLSGSVPDPLPHDDDGSRRLLEEAGWTVGTDGVRTREGERFQFTALVGGENDVGRAVYIQAQLKEVGVQMDIQTLSGGIAGRLRAGDFQAAFGRFEPFQPGDIQWLRDRIALGYENPRVRELVDAAQATMNPVVEDSIYRLLMPIILADQPVTMLFPSIETFVASARITGLTSPYRSNPALFAEFLRLEGAPGNRSP